MLQRHANRFQTGGDDDGVIDQNFAVKLTNFASSNQSAAFSGPLTFLNTYQYILQDTGLLTGLGASAEFMAGVTFWNRYGRTLYNASVAQLAYNATAPDGTSREKPVLRTTGQSRIENSLINWALGFFGTSFQKTPNPTIANFTSEFDVVIIPEGGSENNTLASYDSCFNDNDPVIGYLGDLDLFTYIPKYLGAATARLQKYAPPGFKFTTNDTYAMQSICAYETTYIGVSDFCGLFTADEWAGFENTLDMECKSLLPSPPTLTPKLTPALRLLRLRLRQPHRPRPRHRLPARTPLPTPIAVHPELQHFRQQHPRQQRRPIPARAPLLRRLHPRRHHHLSPNRHVDGLLPRPAQHHAIPAQPKQAFHPQPHDAFRRPARDGSDWVCGAGSCSGAEIQGAVYGVAVWV